MSWAVLLSISRGGRLGNPRWRMSGGIMRQVWIFYRPYGSSMCVISLHVSFTPLLRLLAGGLPSQQNKPTYLDLSSSAL